MKTLWFGVVVGTLLLAGCSGLLPKPAPLPARHDFGPVATRAPVLTKFSVTASVSAPAWLDSTAIHYRLVYADATRVRAYADNRWVAPPAKLLQARLRVVFGNRAADIGKSTSTYRLTVRLLDFEQDFTTAHAAATRIRAVGELQNVSGGVTFARHVFSLSQPAQPDVNGAVQSASRAADMLVADLVRWVGANVAAKKVPPADAPHSK